MSLKIIIRPTFYTTVIFIFVVQIFFAQKTRFYSTPKELNRFSLDGFIGTTTALSNLPKSLGAKQITFFKPDIAARYMFNKCFGLQGDLSFEFFKSKRKASEINSFKTVNLRFSTQFVFNIGRTFHFEKFAPKISMLAYIGGGTSSLRDARTTWWKSWRNNYADEKLNLIFGLSGQYKYNNRIVFYVNTTILTHYHQDSDFNFGPWNLNPKKLQGTILNGNIGVSYYFGKYKEHVDWYVAPPKDVEKTLHLPIVDSALITRMDRDLDGVADTVDVCPDVKGLAEFFGCPDQQKIANCETHEFPIILFDISSTVITSHDKLRIDELANCMKINQSQKFIIHGYSDNIGDPVSIEDISYRRALNVKRQLTQLGIDKDRLIAIAEGADRPAIEDSIYKGIKHNRIVYFELISNNAYDVKELSTNLSLQGLFFTIQVGAFEQIPADLKLEKYGRVFYSKSQNKTIARYSVGLFHSTQEAVIFLEGFKKKGIFKDAFVTAYYLGERLTNKRATSILIDKGLEILEKK